MFNLKQARTPYQKTEAGPNYGSGATAFHDRQLYPQTDDYAAKMLRDVRMAALVKPRCSVRCCRGGPVWAGQVDHPDVAAVALRVAPLWLQAVWRCAIERPQFLTGTTTLQEAHLRLRVSVPS